MEFKGSLHTWTLLVVNSEWVQNPRQHGEHQPKPVQGRQKLHQAERHDWLLVRRCNMQHSVTVAVCNGNGLDNEKVTEEF